MASLSSGFSIYAISKQEFDQAYQKQLKENKAKEQVMSEHAVYQMAMSKVRKKRISGFFSSPDFAHQYKVLASETGQYLDIDMRHTSPNRKEGTTIYHYIHKKNTTSIIQQEDSDQVQVSDEASSRKDEVQVATKRKRNIF